MKKKLLSLIAIALFQTHLVAQWHSNGPYGGPVPVVEVVGSTIYAGTGHNGVFKSTDVGQTWTEANNGIVGLNITAMASFSGRIYAGTSENGIYVSSDNGAHWTLSSAGLSNFNISSLFVSTHGLYAGTSGGAYVSVNGGASWSPASNGIPNTYNVYAWAQVGDTLMAATYGTGLFKSYDWGGTWTQVNGGLPIGPTGAYFYSLFTISDTVFAGTNLGIYKSVNGGHTWNLSNNGMPSGVYAVSFTKLNGTLFVGTHSAGIFKSTDGGNSWTASRTGLKTWTRNNMGPDFEYDRVNEMAVSGSAVFAASFDNLYRSTDGGSTWNVSSNGILNTWIMALAATSGVAICGEQTTGSFMTGDHGVSWTRDNAGLPDGLMLDMCARGSVLFAAIENYKVFCSKDNGNSWTSASTGLSAVVEMMAADSTRVLAVTRGGFNYNQKLYVSMDDGAHWSELTGANAISGGISAIAVHRQYIYVGTYNGMLLRSSDNGASWLDISGYLPSVEITAIVATDANTYIGTNGNGVFKTYNNDQNMVAASIGLTNYHVTSLVVQGEFLFAGTWNGLFASRNNADSWFDVSGGIEMPYITRLASANSDVYVGTKAGVYVADQNAFDQFRLLAGIAFVVNADENILFPNPCRDKVMFTKDAHVVHAWVLNINGQTVLESSTGNSIDVSGLPRGIYMVRVNNGIRYTNHKLVVD